MIENKKMKEAKFTAGQMVTHQCNSDIPLKLRVVRNIWIHDEVWVQCCWMCREELKMEAFPEEKLKASTGFLNPVYFLKDE